MVYGCRDFQWLLSAEAKHMGPVLAGRLKERICDTEEQTRLRRHLIHKSGEILIMDGKVGTKIARNR